MKNGNKVVIQASGYSGTPLAKKLGIKSGNYVKLINAPEYYFDLFSDLPSDLSFNNITENKIDIIHFFSKSKDEYIIQLPVLKTQITTNGFIWVSWPKKASKVMTDVTEDVIRNYAIQIGLVDIKVCAIDEMWSGLKLVIPVKDRV